MREFVLLETRSLLRHLKTQVKLATETGTDDSIHDLRVTIRRLNRCLRVFAPFYPGHSWKPIRRRLSELMSACGSVRDRDIAIGLLEQAGVAATSPLVRRLGAERDAAARE